MIQRILSRLGEIERQYGVKILYACESGSRAWGMASADSDYDVRFIYVHERDWYLTVNPGGRPDVIDAGIEETPNGILDCNGWDVRKALRLLQKSNAGLLEWLFSPIVYKNEGTFAEDVRTAAPKIISLIGLWHHYRHLRNNSLEHFKSRPTAKVWLYALRPQLAMLWIEKKQSIPPVEFAVLVEAVCPRELHAAVRDILEAKKNGKEAESGFTPKLSLTRFLEMERERGNIVLVEPSAGHVADLDEIFRNAIGKIDLKDK